MPPDDIVITRPGEPCRSRSSSRPVNKNGPTTWPATVSSMPDGAARLVAVSEPALWIRVSSRACRRRTSAAAARTASKSAKSATTTSRLSLPVRATSWSRTRCVFVRSRPISTTVALQRANCSAAHRPIPDVAPVISTTRPVRS